jgi:alpha-tubulin suppressor-like RCC1 family protein
LAKV